MQKQTVTTPSLNAPFLFLLRINNQELLLISKTSPVPSFFLATGIVINIGKTFYICILCTFALGCKIDS